MSEKIQDHNWTQSNRLTDAAYDVRDPKIYTARKEIEATIKQETEDNKLNIKQIHSWHIGNPTHFSIEPPPQVKESLTKVIFQKGFFGYTIGQGRPESVEAVCHYHQRQGIKLKEENIFLTEGGSEAIRLSLLAALNPGDEILLPSPNYPLWRLYSHLADAKVIHYKCDEQANWYPDIADIKRKISSQTKALVIINPNNPTGSLYPKEILEQIIKLAVENKLIILTDEIYNEICYDGAVHIPLASLSNDALIITINGLTKNRLVPGIRAGWLGISGPTALAKNLIDGINLLANARLNSNTFGQFAIPELIEKKYYLTEYISPGGRLYEQIKTAHRLVNNIDGLSCHKASAGFYLYVRLDPKFKIENDQEFILQLLNKERVQLVGSKGFDDNSHPKHLRLVCLAPVNELIEGINRIARFLYQE